MESYNNSVWFGGTNIAAGLNNARLHMEANSNPNRDRFIIVFTDGKYTHGGSPVAEAEACLASGIVVHSITFSDGANTTDMDTLANKGGGQHFHADGTSELETIFKRLAGSFAILTD